MKHCRHLLPAYKNQDWAEESLGKLGLARLAPGPLGQTGGLPDPVPQNLRETAAIAHNTSWSLLTISPTVRREKTRSLWLSTPRFPKLKESPKKALRKHRPTRVHLGVRI